MTITPAPPRRVTPNGFLLLSAAVIEKDRPLWLAARRSVIGGSDAPRILNIFPSPLRVYLDKQGALPEDDASEATDARALRMRMGHRFETPIAEEWTMRSRSVTRRMGMVANVDAPWVAATIDRRVSECPLPEDAPCETAGGRNVCSLEVKLTTVFLAPKWKRQVPDSVLAQVMHSMRATGDDHQHVAVNIGGTDGYRQFTVYRDGTDRDVYDYVADQVDEFYQYHLLPELPPNSVDPELPDDLHPDRAGILDVTDPETVLAIIEARDRYDALTAQKGEITKAHKEARGALLAYLDGAEAAKADNQLLFSYFEMAGRPLVDLDGLAEHHPDIYAQYVTPSTHRTINTRARSRKG